MTCVGVCAADSQRRSTGNSRKLGHMHPLYGRQVQVRYYEKSMPTTTAGMEKYLSSGMIKGIGAENGKADCGALR